MDTGRRQKGNKKISNDGLKSRIIGVEVKKDVPKVSIDTVRTVTGPDCNKTVQVKKVAVGVSAKRNPVRIENVGKEATSYTLGDVAGISGDGTDIFNFRTGGVKAKAGKADILNGDGTDGFNFSKKRR